MNTEIVTEAARATLEGSPGAEHGLRAMGCAANVSQQIRRDKAQKKRQKLPHELRQLIESVKI